MSPAELALVLPAGATCGLALLNCLLAPRGRLGQALPCPTSLLIPARNEELGIGACLDAALAVADEDPQIIEIIVCDDGSEDGTAGLVAERARRDPRLRCIQGQPLPRGWVGKVWACEQLAQAARGELLLYIDADVQLAAGAASRLSSLLDPGAAAVTVVPQQRALGPVERSLMPLLHLSYVAWLFLPLVRWIADPRVTAANGQVLLLRRAALARIGGWSSVRAAVVDDMALCRRLKEQGLSLCFTDGGAIASCLMYRSAAALWRGFSKNLYPGIGGTPLALALVLLLHLACFVLPYIALLLAAWRWPSLLPAAGLAVGLNLLMRLAMALRFRHAPESILTHPIAVLGLMAIALNSWSWSRRGAIQWAGRSYPMAGP